MLQQNACGSVARAGANWSLSVQDGQVEKHVVYVIDDDRSVRTMISRMIGAVDDEPVQFTPHPFASASDFLEALDTLKPGCILLDLRMPDIDGFGVMAELRRRDIDWPTIVLTGASEVQIAVQAMKLGAIEFLEKPVRLDPLVDTLRGAAALLRQRLETSDRRRAAKSKIDQLSPREHEVLGGLIAGQSNKELAQSLGIGLRTVEMHRGNMMDRLGVSSVAQVVALALEAGIRPRQDETAS
jgi:two-component system response regulator FixJ